MLELHIDLSTAGIVVEKIEQRIVLSVDPEGVSVFVEHKVLQQHKYLPIRAGNGPASFVLSLSHILRLCNSHIAFYSI